MGEDWNESSGGVSREEVCFIRSGTSSAECPRVLTSLRGSVCGGKLVGRDTIYTVRPYPDRSSQYSCQTASIPIFPITLLLYSPCCLPAYDTRIARLYDPPH
jgi:hypothetical protein